MYSEQLGLSDEETYALYKELKQKFNNQSKQKTFSYDRIKEEDNQIIFYDSNLNQNTLSYDYVEKEFRMLGRSDFPKSWLTKIEDVEKDSITFDSPRLERFYDTLMTRDFYGGEGYRQYRYIDGWLKYQPLVSFLEKMSYFENVRPVHIGTYKKYLLLTEKSPYKVLNIPKSTFNILTIKREASFTISDWIYQTRRLENIDFTLINKLLLKIENLGDVIRFYSSYKSDENYYSHYSLDRLLEYVTEDCQRQGITSTTEAFEVWRDYIVMCKDLELPKFEKYPRYLKTMHDIVQMNFRYKEDEIKNKKFATQIKDRKHLEFVSKNKELPYIVKNPIVTKDLVKEGSSLSHCVSVYIDKVIDGKTFINFLRFKSKEEESLLTLEIQGDKLYNAKGFGNRLPNQKEKEFLQLYCKEKSLEPDFLRYWR